MSGAALPFAPPPPAPGERAGLLAALALHVALLGALSLSWGTPPAPPPAEPEPITVSLVHEVAPTATAPPAPEPPAPSIAPDQGEPEDAAPPPAPEPKPEPVKPVPEPKPKAEPPKPKPEPVTKAEPKPQPAAKAEPKPQPATKAEPKPKPAPVKPAPAEKPKAAKATAKPVDRPAPDRSAEKPAPAKAAPKTSRLAGLGQELAAGAKADAARTRGHKLGADFLSGLAADVPAKKASAAAPAAKAGPFPTASIQGAIQRQIQPCADRQVVPGPGANEIVTVLNVRLNEDGTLAATPRIVRQSGLSDENNRYAQRVADLGIAAFKGCTPLHLPAEYYQTAGGAGWNNINYRWQLK